MQGVLDAGAARLGLHAAGGGAGSVAALIDHTLLKPDATAADIETLCREAAEHRFATRLRESDVGGAGGPAAARHGVGVCSVVGFPLGATTADVKAYETRRAIVDGATEIDMVINVGALKSGELRLVEQDIEAVVGACRVLWRHQQGHHRGGAAHRRREGHRLHAGQGGRGRLRQDVDRASAPAAPPPPTSR